MIQALNPSASSLIGVACGTGGHLAHLRHWYEVAGVDADPGMLLRARARLPHTSLVEADMRSFQIGRTFDAAVCLFSSVGYMSRTRGATSSARPDQRAFPHLAIRGILETPGVLFSL